MRNCLLIFILCFSSLVKGQEVVSHLVSNPILESKKLVAKKNKNAIVLPFIDDFSYNSSVVNTDLWEQSSVFVNKTYPINPVTIGVATFDGLDEYGFARDFYPASFSEPSDTLLSQIIDLSGQSSLYFLFYFQGKGIGDAPQIQDKLVLEFLNDTVWNEVWSSNGQSMAEFEKEVIIIDSAIYLINNFQFRFRNYATISGNFDHWHIDYVKLDVFLSTADTTELNDVSFVYPAPSFLKRYEQMPWAHFKNNKIAEMNDTATIVLRNNKASINVDYHYNIFEGSNQIAHYPTLGVSRNESVFDFDSIGNFEYKNPAISVDYSVFSSLQPDSVSFLVEHVIGTGLDDYKINDTLSYTQVFNSSFAYDDGTAESAYGINVNGAKLAYEFKLNRPDTLRAIQMYFPQMLDSVNHIPFKLTVWNNNGGQPGNIIHQQIVNPVHTENGKFHTYYLDSLFQMVGTFYVGWEQITSDLLNVGLDKNKLANQYMYYNVGAGWAISSYPGSWLVRPLVSEYKILSTLRDVKASFKVYPNPASTTIIVESKLNNNQISIYNIQGILLKEIYSSDFKTSINISDLSPAVYFVEVLSNNDKQYQKIIIE
jgi:hypothetical protein